MSNVRNTAVAKRAADEQKRTVLDMVRDLAPQYHMATKGTPLDGDRFMRIALTELRMNPGLLECTRESVLGGLMLSAQLGLEVGSALGQTWLVPFKNRKTARTEATWILGYRGIVALAARSDIHVVGRMVHEADEFSYAIRDGRDVIEHRPEKRTDPGPTWLWYATATWEGGYTAMVLSRAEVEVFRQRSKAKDTGPWVTDYDAMAIKTAVRRLAPWLPMRPQTADALAVDETTVSTMDVDLGELAAAVRTEEPDAIDTDEAPTETTEVES
jgi:recombination protein RecT